MFVNTENNCQFAGRLVRDPEVRGSNGNVLKFTVANNNSYIDQNGQKQEKSTFFECVVFGKNAEYWSTRLEKGDYVAVQASFENTMYEKDGVKVYGYQFKVNAVKSFMFLTGKTQTAKAEAQDKSHYQPKESAESMGIEENDIDDIY